MGVDLLLRNVRLGYSAVFRKIPSKKNENKVEEIKRRYEQLLIQDPINGATKLEEALSEYLRYTATLIIGDQTNLNNLIHTCQKVATDTWKENGTAMYQRLLTTDCLCFHSGNNRVDPIKNTGYEYADKFYVNASNTKFKPTTVDETGMEVLENSGKLYAGSWANVKISLWGQDNVHGKRINATLIGLKHIRDDTPLYSLETPCSADELD